MYEQGQLQNWMFSLYLGLQDEESKIWLGGYDRNTVKKMLIRYQSESDESNYEEMSSEELDEQIRWRPLVSKYYWMTLLQSAEINGIEWPITFDSIIMDSGSSINHIPTKDYNILMSVIVGDHRCRTVMNPLETYYCECEGADDPTYPMLKLNSGNITFNFHPKDYLVYERIDINEPPSCMISFQEETRENTSFWLLGDSFLRAFYTIYDGQNKRIGFVGDITYHPDKIVDETIGKDDDDSSSGVNILYYILPGVISLLCCVAICISCRLTKKLRQRQ